MTNCEKCGDIIHEKTAFCPHCGVNRGLEYIVKICPECKKEYAGDTDFCTDDGLRLVDPDKLVPKCINCNKAYEYSVKFCPKDGGEIIPEAYRKTSATYFSGFDGSTISDMSKKIGEPVAVTGVNFATFGERVAASIIDSIIAWVAGLILGLLFSEAGVLVSFIAGYAYYILFETSNFMGTPGKIALQLRVLDVHGNRLSITKSLVRNVSKLVSGIILCIGYLFPLFTPCRQTLHDMIAGCVVVKA